MRNMLQTNGPQDEPSSNGYQIREHTRSTGQTPHVVKHQTHSSLRCSRTHLPWSRLFALTLPSQRRPYGLRVPLAEIAKCRRTPKSHLYLVLTAYFLHTRVP